MDSVSKRVRQNTGMMLAAKSVAAVMALGGLAFAARGLTTEEFGLLVFLHAFILFFTEIATFHSWLVVVRHAANGLTGEELQNKPLFGRVVRFSVALDLLASILAFTTALFVAYLLSGWIVILSDASPYVFVYACLILLNQKSASIGVLRLYNRYDLLALNALTIPGGRMIGCGLAWAFGLPFEYYLLAWFIASGTAYLVMPILGIREMRRRGTWDVVRGGPLSLRAPVAGVWRFVAKTNIDTSLATGASHLPVLLAGGLGGASYAAIFRIAQEVAIVLAKGTTMIDKVLYPEFTALIARGEGTRVPGLVMKTGAILLGIGATIGLVFWVGGPAFLTFALGDAYAQATGLAVLLILGTSLSASVAPLFPAFYAAGIPGQAILARIAGVAVMIGSFILLYNMLGQIGPGFAIIIGALITVASATFIAMRHDWSSGSTQLDASRSLTDAASTSAAVLDKSGGPGQPGSDRS